MAGLIDTSLIRPELTNAFAAGYRGAEQARQQSAQAAQQLARGRQQMQMDEMKMRQFQEDRAALTGLQAKLRAAGQSDDPKVFFRALTESNDPNIIMKGIEGLQRFQALEAYEREFGPGATTPASAPGAITAPAPAAAPEGELVAAPIRPIPSPTVTPAAANAPAPAGETSLAYLQRQFGTPGGAAAGPNALAPAAAPASTNAMIAAQPAAPAPDVNALMRRYNLASRAGSPDAPLILKQVEAAIKGDTLSDIFVPVGNMVFNRRTGQFITPTEAQLAMVRAQQQPAALVPILQNGRPVLVPREQAVGQTPFSPASVQVLGMGPQRETAAAGGGESRAKAPAGYRYTSAGDLEPIPGGPASPSLNPKDIQKREAAFPQAKQAVSTVRNTMSVIKQTIDRLLENESGLNGVTGLIGGITPGITDAARQAVADLDQLKNLAFIQGITELRNASKTGAGVGNVSNKEGDRFENLKASLARSQSLDSMKNALKRLRDQADITDTTIQDAFDETYEYRTQRGAGGSAPAAKQMSPQDKQALDWANSNPKDPRAAQIKARLGVQ
jgi:hypothetical protein